LAEISRMIICFWWSGVISTVDLAVPCIYHIKTPRKAMKCADALHGTVYLVSWNGSLMLSLPLSRSCPTYNVAPTRRSLSSSNRRTAGTSKETPLGLVAVLGQGNLYRLENDQRQGGNLNVQCPPSKQLSTSRA